MWKNIIELGRPQMIVWCMRIAYWIPKATNTLSDYATLIALPLQQWLYEHASMFVIHILPALLCTCLFFTTM